MFRGLQSKDFHVSSRFPSFLRWDLPVVPRLALTSLAQVTVPVLGSWWDTVLSLSELLTQTGSKQGAKTQTPHSHQALCSLTALVCPPVTLSNAFWKDSLNVAQSTNSVYLGTQRKVAKKLLIFMSHSQTGPQLSNILSVPFVFNLYFLHSRVPRKCMLVKDTQRKKPNPWLHPHCK